MAIKKLIVLIIGALLLAAGFYLGTRLNTIKTTSLPQDIGSILEWKKYTSEQANLSFEYPNNWIITDNIIKGYSQKDENQSFPYNVLDVCPPDSQILSAPKEGLNNCITFIGRNRLLNPIAGFSDESTIFKDFDQYINSTENQYDNLRIWEQKITADHDGAINLIGLYRTHQNLIGMYQMLCAEKETARCLLVFNHVLDSIVLFN